MMQGSCRRSILITFQTSSIFLLFGILINLSCSFAQHQNYAGVLTKDSVHCSKIKDQLFLPTNATDLQRMEWERFLPVFVKTQLFDLMKDKRRKKGPEMEFPMDFNYGRFHMLGPLGPQCRTALESYGAEDDEKRACGLQQLQKINQVTSEDGKKHACVIYSVGSNNQWGFEEDIIKKTDCKIETFDCTLPKNFQLPSHLKGRVRFHPLCLADADYEIDGRKFVSWTTLNKITGVATQPTFLKMDIEGYEFPVLRSIVDSGVYLPLQIALEVHFIRRINNIPDERRVNSMELYSFFNYLYKFGGYYLIDRHDNPRCKACTEVVLAKLNCENYPRPENYQDLILTSENKQLPLFDNAVKESFVTKYYG